MSEAKTGLEMVTEELEALRADVEKALNGRLKASNEGETDLLAQFDERLKAIEERIDDAEQKRQIIERAQIPGLEVGRNGEAGKFSWARAMKVAVFGEDEMAEECGLEIEAFRETKKNMTKEFMGFNVRTAINATTGASGGFLIPVEAMTDILEELRAQSVAMSLGVTPIEGLVGETTWSRNTGGITAEYLDTEAEESGTETVPTFTQIRLRPHVMGAFVPLTWEMLTQPAVAMEQWVRSEIVDQLALREDKSIFIGDSNEGEPRGIVNVSGIGSTSWSGTVFSGTSQTASDKLRDHVKDLMDANAFQGARRLGWAASPDTIHKLSLSKDQDGRDLFLAQNDPMVQRLLTYPVAVSTQLDQTDDTDEFLLFGDFARCVNGHWGTLALASSSETETNFRKARTTVRGLWAHDVGVLQPGAFSNATALDVS